MAFSPTCRFLPFMNFFYASVVSFISANRLLNSFIFKFQSLKVYHFFLGAVRTPVTNLCVDTWTINQPDGLEDDKKYEGPI